MHFFIHIKIGIEIDENLSWNNQIEILAKNLSRTNSILPKPRYYVPKKSLTLIHCSLFQWYIAYGSTIWSFASQKMFFTKNVWDFLFSDYREHTSPIFKSFKVLKLQDIIQFSILKITFFNNQLPLQVKNIFIQNKPINPYKLRGGKLLFICHITTTHFLYKIIKT